MKRTLKFSAMAAAMAGAAFSVAAFAGDVTWDRLVNSEK